jgi:hypothetical protein
VRFLLLTAGLLTQLTNKREMNLFQLLLDMNTVQLCNEGRCDWIWVKGGGSNEVCGKQRECGNEERYYVQVNTRERVGVILNWP